MLACICVDASSSCRQFPYGSPDPIKDLGALAASRGVGLHVDCCLGSFPVTTMGNMDHVCDIACRLR